MRATSPVDPSILDHMLRAVGHAAMSETPPPSPPPSLRLQIRDRVVLLDGQPIPLNLTPEAEAEREATRRRK